MLGSSFSTSQMSRGTTPAAGNLTAQALARYKKEHGLTLDQMQELSGVSRDTMMDIWKGEIATTAAVLKKLGRFFEWTAVELGQAALYEPVKKEGKKKKK